jgi:hypothetical protein
MNKDNRPERNDYRKVHKDWNQSLDDVCITGKSAALQASKNYKAHVGKTARELKDLLEMLGEKKEILDTFTEEELKRHTRLEQKQIDKLENVSTREEALKELKKVRDIKDWW